MDEIRQQLLDEVSKFFVGPRSNADPLPTGNMPLDMYTTGILFPMDAPQEDIDKEGSDGEGEEDREDSNNEKESQKFLKQNSIGLRVDIKDDVRKIQLAVNYGKYAPSADEVWERSELDVQKQTYELDLSKSKGEIIISDGANLPESKVSWYFYRGGSLNVFLENATIWVEPDKEDDLKKEKTGKAEKKKTLDYKEAKIQNNINSIFKPSSILASTLSQFSIFVLARPS